MALLSETQKINLADALTVCAFSLIKEKMYTGVESEYNFLEDLKKPLIELQKWLENEPDFKDDLSEKIQILAIGFNYVTKLKDPTIDDEFIPNSQGIIDSVFLNWERWHKVVQPITNKILSAQEMNAHFKNLPCCPKNCRPH